MAPHTTTAGASDRSSTTAGESVDERQIIVPSMCVSSHEKPATLVPRNSAQSSIYDVNTRVVLTQSLDSRRQDPGSRFNPNPRSLTVLSLNSAKSRAGNRDTYVGSTSGLPVGSVPDTMARQPTKANVIGLDTTAVFPSDKRASNRTPKGFYPTTRMRSGSVSRGITSGSEREKQLVRRSSSKAESSGPKTRKKSTISANEVASNSRISETRSDSQASTEKPTSSQAASTPSVRLGVSPAHASTSRSANQYVLEPEGKIPKSSRNLHGYISDNSKMASRNNPWVYRFKIKKTMNGLNKILANEAVVDAEYSGVHVLYT